LIQYPHNGCSQKCVRGSFNRLDELRKLGVELSRCPQGAPSQISTSSAQSRTTDQRARVVGVHSLPGRCRLQPFMDLDPDNQYGDDLTLKEFICQCGAPFEPTSIEFANCRFQMEYTKRSTGIRMVLPSDVPAESAYPEQCIVDVREQPLKVDLWPKGVTQFSLVFHSDRPRVASGPLRKRKRAGRARVLGKTTGRCASRGCQAGFSVDLDLCKQHDLTQEEFKCQCGAPFEATGIEFTNCRFQMEYNQRSTGIRMVLPANIPADRAPPASRIVTVGEEPTLVQLWPAGTTNFSLTFHHDVHPC